MFEHRLKEWALVDERDEREDMEMLIKWGLEGVGDEFV